MQEREKNIYIPLVGVVWGVGVSYLSLCRDGAIEKGQGGGPFVPDFRCTVGHLQRRERSLKSKLLGKKGE